jgi:hypothetical protein
MNWIKTYESYIYEGSSDKPEVNRFESIIGIRKGTGVITSVILDNDSHTLRVSFMDKVNVFDVENVTKSVNKNLKSLKTEYGIKLIHLGSAIIEL